MSLKYSDYLLMKTYFYISQTNPNSVTGNVVLCYVCAG